MESKELCLKLARADTEEEVIKILKKEGYWDDPNCWRLYGDLENNFSTIGNQQSSADTALVEKIINSVDAVLMRECITRNVTPDGPDAPESIEEALKEFFDIDNGRLVNLHTKERFELAKNIQIVATGTPKNPSYSIIDKGEGQSPKKMPETFLSLIKSNKVRIPFVQGKFNMGGTGSLLFCGYDHIQLIISRRCPEIVEIEGDDGTSDLWGFTIVRREKPTENMKSSTYTYLAPKNNVLSFKADTIPLLPGQFPEAYEMPLEWGSFIKLYEYQLQPSSLKSLINLNLNYRLSLLLPSIALPVLLQERREYYKGHTMHSVLSGLSVRLDEDKRENIEEGYPSSEVLNINGQKLNVNIYVFKRRTRIENYKKNQGIIFTINGQSHGYINKAFFTRKSVGMKYLSDSILVIVDCTDIDGDSRDNLFMNSRDRLRDGALKKEIEKELENLIKNHQGLRELKAKRREEEIKDKVKESKPLADILKNVITKSPTLSTLLIQGNRISDPFNFTKVGEKEKFNGKLYPTFFKLVKKFSEEKPKHAPLNHKFRVQFETDANNDYFTRENYPGEFKIYYKNKEYDKFNIGLWNGIANLNCELPNNSERADILEFKFEVTDPTQLNPFSGNFYVMVDNDTKNNKHNGNFRAKPAGGKGNKKESPSALDLPQVIRIYRDNWDDQSFDRESALAVKGSEEDGYDFFVNMSNVYLENESKLKSNEPELLKSQYESALVLVGLSLLNASNKHEEEEEPVFEIISKVTTALSPVILPMINSLGDLKNN